MTSEMSLIFSPRLNRALLLLTLLYLYLPNLLFLQGWVRPWAAIPLALLWLAALLWGYLRCRTEDEPVPGNATCSALLPALAALAAALLCTELIGLNGHVLQHYDFVARNPIYQSLCREAWPLYSQRGDYFIYYHTFWLPAAALSKWVSCADALLFVWCALGFWLMLMLLHARCGWRCYLFVLLLLLLGWPLELCELGRVSLVKYLGSDYAALDAATQACYAYLPTSFNVRFVPVYLQCICTFHHAIPLLLVLSLVVTQRLSLPGLVTVSSLVVSCSPLGAASLAVVLVVLLFHQRGSLRRCLRTPAIWLALPPLAVVALYFTGSFAGGAHCFLQGEVNGWGTEGLFLLSQTRLLAYVLLVLGMVIPLLAVLRREASRSPYLHSCCLLVLVLPLLWVGLRNNELLFKGSCTLLFLGAWLLFCFLNTRGSLRKGMLALLLLANGPLYASSLRAKIGSYTWNSSKVRQNFVDPCGGDINRMNKCYLQFFGKNPCPVLFYNRPGESRQL